MSLTAKINIILNIVHETSLDLNTPKDSISLTRGKAFTNGTGANQCDTIFHDNRTLADGANETLVFNDSSLTDAFGAGVAIDEFKALYIKNNSTDANLEVGGAAATQIGLFKDTSDILVIKPGGEFLYIAPDASGLDVTTNSSLKVAHDGTGSSSLTYDIIAVGVA